MHSSCKPASRSEVAGERPGSEPARYRRRAATCLTLILFASVSRSFAADIAVAVHPEVRVENLSFAELRKILLGDRQFWPSGQPVTLIVRAPVAEERTLLLEKVYEMTEPQFRQYWIAKVFRAEATSGPRVVVSNDESLELINVLTGAIALVSAADVPAGVKVLKIDGMKPGDRDYPLRSTKTSKSPSK
jgi:hypothetical protein